MLAYFPRFRALRGKSVEGVAHDSLQRSCCAMIIQWNRMLRVDTSFVDWIEAREEVIGNYSLRDLWARVCTNAWDATSKCVKAAPSVEARELLRDGLAARSRRAAARRSGASLDCQVPACACRRLNVF
ncbi:hypothetical protein PF001_g12709 [Phytophthora fragariae]|uniref:Uncharacterized protein n=1 Tax=Phytophthora fragariae TaxID=53985 RepID=A0A6A3JTL8_9STRA|nr:hypothetical protein PF003_g16294 [Phytophthora fragariae]KAE8995524.1 hypothetical protein PF011_g16301 [Phytophthora fragariae]KAE9194675.1 hypothetical protein PF004_g20659 [Phytophthora fragariae]KAE9305168.1 hypothetical protein PF001_g12709 [Phytophthora fragariae]